MARKNLTLGQLFTDEELARAKKLYGELKHTGRFADTVCKEIVEPKMAHINEVTRQENVPKYIAYIIEYVLDHAEAAE